MCNIGGNLRRHFYTNYLPSHLIVQPLGLTSRNPFEPATAPAQTLCKCADQLHARFPSVPRMLVRSVAADACGGCIQVDNHRPMFKLSRQRGL